MRYLLMLYNDESFFATRPQADIQAEMGAYFGFSTLVESQGKMAYKDALQDSSTATTVRVRDGKTVITDGPFAETREVLGGIYGIECDNLDQAIEFAAKIPSSWHGSVEIRPVIVYTMS